MAGLNREIVDIGHYVVRYVRDGLRVDEREAFEDYCLLHPEVAEQVATDRVLLRGMQALEKEDMDRDAGGWTRYRLAASIAVVVAMVGIWGFLQFGAPAPNALYAKIDTVPTRLASRLSEPLRVVQQRGAPVLLVKAPGREALQLDVVLDMSDTAPEFTVSLIEYTQHGEVERGRTTQAPRAIDDERVLPVVLDLTAVEGRRLRLDVKSASSRQNFELRVVQP